jgi:hypothetical protein
MNLLGDVFYRVEYTRPDGSETFRDYVKLEDAERFCDRLEHRMINDRCDGYNVLKCEVVKDRWI